MARRFVKYNPAFLSKEDLVKNFVVRHADLKMILGVLYENTTNSNQHILVIGPRGSGKTTLALRVAAEIENTAELSQRWYPLIFSEESYRATSATDFWLEALSHLADQTGDQKWKRTYNEMRAETDDQKLGDRPLWQILDFADSRTKRILLIVENLNMLFDDLTSPDEAWKMRHTLMNEPRLMLLATATNSFEDIENPSRAMFEMFKINDLKPLDDDECNAVWASVAGKRLTGRKIRPIRILTGGNPRLIAIVAKFGAHRSFRQLLDDLVDLIDDHTDYFKSRIDHMPATERKVYLSLAELWEPSTARDIARAARLEVSKTSALLGRLTSRGEVVVEARSKKTKWYRIAEGIYNIYYLMRRRGQPADRVMATVRFMVAMYGPESASTRLAQEACALDPECCQDHYLAYGEIIKSAQDKRIIDKIISSTPPNILESPYVQEALKPFAVFEKGSGAEEAAPTEVKADLKAAREANAQGVRFGREGKHEQALKRFEQVIFSFKDCSEASLIAEVAIALVNKGAALNHLDRPEEAIAVYDKLVGRYGKREEKEIAENVAIALVNKAVTLGICNQPKEAEATLSEVIGLAPDLVPAHISLIDLLLKNPERRAEALRKADDIIRRKPDNPPLLNALSWAFYRQQEVSLLPQAETWARKALELSPDNRDYHHTLACILIRLGKGMEALEAAEKYVEDAAFVEKTIDDAIELFVALAAAGFAKEALTLLKESPAAKSLEPLVAGLKLFLGEDVKSAVEIFEVAKDVVGKIHEFKEKNLAGRNS